ncbi:MAG: DUF4468 domain-containing protein [Bacteroidales bacterium]|nr:DUF4468 domain-containing protein [Bacteroidales bacterium]
MKKQLLISGLFLLTIIATKGLFAQSANIPVDEDTKLITYKEVIQQPGDADKLYLTAISWVNSFYNNPNEVTTTRDRENGKLVLDHRFKIFNIDKSGLKTDAGVIKYNLKLEFKPDRYRYTFTDFNLQATSKFPLERWLNANNSTQYENFLYQVDTTVNGIIKSIKKGMVPKIEKPDEW